MEIGLFSRPPISDPRRDSMLSDGLERAFLSEMLKHAGPRPLIGKFSGGVGESQFASMMTDAYADAISTRIDLAFGARFEGEE